MDKYGARSRGTDHTLGPWGAASRAGRGAGDGPPVQDVDRIAKLIPFNATLDDAVRSEPELQRAAEDNTQIHRLLDLSRKLEGVARHCQHTRGGVIISRDPLIEHVPCKRRPKRSGDDPVRHDAVEKIGLLKMDFLGLANLTILDTAMKIIEKTRQTSVDLPSSRWTTRNLRSPGRGRDGGSLPVGSAG